MAQAKMRCTAVEVTCPKCGEFVPDPHQSSFYWTAEQLGEYNGRTRECFGCGAAVKIVKPSRVAF